MSTKVDFITNIAPHYREYLWLELLRDSDLQATFLFGESRRRSVRPIDFSSSDWDHHRRNLVKLRNFSFRKAILWQGGVVARSLATSADVTVFLGDMYILSTWFATIILRLRGKKIIFWGHGVYGSESSLRKIIRGVFLRLPHANIVYGEQAKNLMVRSGLSGETIYIVYNSLDHKKQLELRSEALDDAFFQKLAVFKANELPVLIFVGRFTPQKRLESFIGVVKALNRDKYCFNALLVGDGPEMQRLKNMAQDAMDYIYFAGPCYEERQLARYIANADLCVAPGEVGLTAIHSLGYGTPVCTHSDMSRQMPEAEAIVHNETGMLFEPVEGGLRSAIQAWFRIDRDREQVRQACYAVVDTKFNASNQVRIFKKVFNEVLTTTD